MANVVVISGRLTKDPDVRYTTEGVAVARINVAVDRKYKREGQPNADFVNCVAFGKTAEVLEKYFVKGQQILVNGRIQTGKYDKDGVTHYTTDVAVDSVEFIGKKGDISHDDDDSEYTPPAKSSTTTTKKGSKKKSADDEAPEGFTPINEDDDFASDLPF